jgi:hypothetical protein
MSEFHSVVNEFDTLINSYGFKCPKRLWYRSLVALSKHLEGDFYCFVIASVYEHNGALETTLWVAPIGRPDDALDKLSANIKIHIGYTQILDEEFFKKCETKIIYLIEAGVLTALIGASKKELIKPSVSNRKYEIYTQYILPFYHLVLKAANNDIKILKNKKKTQVIIEQVHQNTTGEMKIFFDKYGIKATIDKIWQLCYIYSL